MGPAGPCFVGGFLRSQLSIFVARCSLPNSGPVALFRNRQFEPIPLASLWTSQLPVNRAPHSHIRTPRSCPYPAPLSKQPTPPPMSEAAVPQPQAAGAPASRSRHGGALDPRAVPCSLLGVKKVRSAATMGPASGEELVSPSKWLRAHEREPQLPQRESRRLLGAAAGNRRRCCSTTAGPLHCSLICPASPSSPMASPLPAASKPSPKERRKAAVPPRDEAPLLGLSSGKDFVHANVQEAAQAAPKYQEQEEVRASCVSGRPTRMAMPGCQLSFELLAPQCLPVMTVHPFPSIPSPAPLLPAPPIHSLPPFRCATSSSPTLASCLPTCSSARRSWRRSARQRSAQRCRRKWVGSWVAGWLVALQSSDTNGGGWRARSSTIFLP